MAMNQQGTMMLIYEKDSRVLQIVVDGSGDTTNLSITVAQK